MVGDVRLMAPQPATFEDPLIPYVGASREPPPEGCWLMANMVAGLDGTASVQGRVGALSGPRDAQLFERMRGLADVVLVGAETVRREGYGPLRLPADLAAARRDAGREQPRLAVVSASLQLSADLPLFRDADPDAPPIVLTTSSSDLTRLDGLAAEVIVAGTSRVDPIEALAHLARRGLRLVLCEGGPRLLGGMIAADLLDEYFLTLTPLIGGDRLPVVDTSDMAELRTFELAHVAEEDGSLFLRYVRGGRG